MNVVATPRDTVPPEVGRVNVTDDAEAAATSDARTAMNFIGEELERSQRAEMKIDDCRSFELYTSRYTMRAVQTPLAMLMCGRRFLSERNYESKGVLYHCHRGS